MSAVRRALAPSPEPPAPAIPLATPPPHPPPPPGAVRMGRAAEPDVVVLSPVEQVVAALVSRAGPVRDLVVGQPGASQQLVGELVLVRLHVVIGVTSQQFRSLKETDCNVSVRLARTETLSEAIARLVGAHRAFRLDS